MGDGERRVGARRVRGLCAGARNLLNCMKRLQKHCCGGQSVGIGAPSEQRQRPPSAFGSASAPGEAAASDRRGLPHEPTPLPTPQVTFQVPLPHATAFGTACARTVPSTLCRTELYVTPLCLILPYR